MTFKAQSLIIIVGGLNNPENVEILISNLLLKYYDMALGNINVLYFSSKRILTTILKGNMNQEDGFRNLLLHPFLLSILL